ncbi:S-adenosyl-L-methionine-dependent methyltransferase [Hypoxylon crocopeplum]|nr:S-adenosyl-L-methionine-dependent methyltransferase [Hypoxylon crocopeplum]
MQQQQQDPGSADGGMERRLDHDDGPARLSATESREAVTLTRRGEVHLQHHLQPQSLQDAISTAAAPAGPSTPSTSSHGAATTGGFDHRGPNNNNDDDEHVHVSSAESTSTSTNPNISSASNPSAFPAAGMVKKEEEEEAATAAESYEQQHVHSVYESIASHFSSTRYKPWPFVASFLSSLAPGSVGLDVGCGNGKYLDVNRDVVILGSDRSANLAGLARSLKVAGGDAGERTAGADVVGVADGLALPFGGTRRVDFAICIAVVHHLSTRERRVEGVRALLDCVKPRGSGDDGGGKVLVYVWALEQGSSRRGWDEGTADQDQLVPWVLKQNKKKQKTEVTGGTGDIADTTYQRYYHLYRKGELEEDVIYAGGEILGSGYEKDNWWVIASPKGIDDKDSSPSIASQ